MTVFKHRIIVNTFQDVLSTVSSQVQTIQDAIRSRASTCEINQRRVNVDINAAIFITLNPVGKGYGGRQRMPDNLKVGV